ncbi:MULTISPECIES: regulatory protein RecX [Luteimonas]|uniref:regulatory protein RecX n=1 Tax=Luteimonas TaxID=83614 RepID=UPI001E5B667D|nr:MULTISPECIES: regulatory protein RecX [Luteimonas]
MGSAPALDEHSSAAGARRRRRPEATPAQRALALLVRREHSRLELERKLLVRGISAEDATLAVERMQGEGWQDDLRFAVSLARMRANTGNGPVRIEAELSTHRLDDAVIADAFRQLQEDGEDDWLARAGDLLARRFDAVALQADMALRRKASDFLLRRGFAGDTVRQAIRHYCGR